ncbi:MAG: oligosaccharide flippase family protein [Saprospiraceae bacterium]|nr:oligosaccharide flippase family protein [Saprospiraceae bacterium]
MGLGLLFSTFLWLGAPLVSGFFGNEQMVSGLRKFAIVPILLLPTLGLDGIFASYQQTHLLAIYNTLNRILMLVCIVVPVIWIENSTDMAINGWIAASILNFGLAMWFRNLPFKGVVSQKSNISTNELFNYSIPLVIASVWGIVLTYSDQYYISHYFGAEVYAEYSNGFIEIPFVGVISSSIAVVLIPIFSKYNFNSSDKSIIVEIWKNSISKSILLIIPITAFCFIFSSEIINFIFSNKYQNSSLFFKSKSILNFFNVVNFMPILLSIGATKFYARIHIFLALLSWIAGYIVYYLFGDPYFNALISITISILAVLIVGKFVLKKTNTHLLEIFDVKKYLTLLLISFVLSISINYVINNSIFSLIFGFIIFSVSILVIDNFLNLGYKSILSPFVKKVLK